MLFQQVTNGQYLEIGTEMKPWKPKLVVPSEEERLSSAEPLIANAEEVDAIAAPTARRTEWMYDQQLSVFILLGLTIGILYLTYIIFRPFLTALFLALVLAIAFFPLHRWVSRRVHNASLAALTTTTLVMLAILVPFILISARLATEATNIYRAVLQPLGNPASWPDRLDPLIQEAAHQTGVPAEQLKADIMNRVRESGGWLLGFATSLARIFSQQLATAALVSAFLFSFLRSSDELRHGALSLLPLSPQRARELAATVNQSIVANIYGMLAVGVAEGALIALGFWLTGLRSPLVWGAVATVLSCLPFVGVSLVWIPACVLLALRGNWANAVLLLVWCLVVVSTAEGIIRCRVVSGRVKINSLLVTLSLVGGLAVFGWIGFFVGPVVLALAVALVRILREEHASLRESRGQV